MEKLVLIMKGMIDFNLLTVLVVVPILGAAVFFGCDGVLEPVTFGDDDTDGGTDGDTDGDTDTDADAEPCTVVAWDNPVIYVDGVCQEEGESCSGGYVYHSPEGNCSGGKWCCVGDDQCVVQAEQYDDIYTWCEPYSGDGTTCDGAWIGISYVGCPPNAKYCCIGYAGER